PFKRDIVNVVDVTRRNTLPPQPRTHSTQRQIIREVIPGHLNTLQRKMQPRHVTPQAIVRRKGDSEVLPHPQNGTQRRPSIQGCSGPLMVCLKLSRVTGPGDLEHATTGSRGGPARGLETEEHATSRVHRSPDHSQRNRSKRLVRQVNRRPIDTLIDGTANSDTTDAGRAALWTVRGLGSIATRGG